MGEACLYGQEQPWLLLLHLRMRDQQPVGMHGMKPAMRLQGDLDIMDSADQPWQCLLAKQGSSLSTHGRHLVEVVLFQTRWEHTRYGAGDLGARSVRNRLRSQLASTCHPLWTAWAIAKPMLHMTCSR